MERLMAIETLELKPGTIFPDEAVLKKHLADNSPQGTRVIVFRLPGGQLKVHDTADNHFRAGLKLVHAQAVAEQLRDDSAPYIVA